MLNLGGKWPGMKKIKALLVDDEPDAIEVMDNLLSDFDNVEVLGKVSDAFKVESALNKIEPDVVFLDINMPGINGIQLLENIRAYNSSMHVVIVSAHRNYMSEAILFNVFAFLLKPVNRHYLKDIIERIYALEKQEELKLSNGTFKLPVSDGYIYIKSSEIVLLEAEGNYSRITLINNQSYLSSYNMGRLFKKLPQKDFYRINRACVMNKNYLYRIDKNKRNCTAKFGENKVTKEISGVFITNFNKTLH